MMDMPPAPEQPGAATPQAPPLELKSVAEHGWTTTMPPPVDPILSWHSPDGSEGGVFIEGGTTCVLAGQPGVGKSAFVQMLGMATAAGGNVFSNSPVLQAHEPRSVLYLAYEHSIDDAHRRFHAAGKSAGESAFFMLPLMGTDARLLEWNGGTFQLTPTFEQVLKALDAPPPNGAPPWGLVIVDTLARGLHPQAERPGHGTAAWALTMEKITSTRFRPAGLVPTHTAKARMSAQDAGMEDVRGGTELVGAARWSASMWKKDDDSSDALFAVTKYNNGPKPPPLRLGFTAGGFFQWLEDGAESAAAGKKRLATEKKAQVWEPRILGVLSRTPMPRTALLAALRREHGGAPRNDDLATLMEGLVGAGKVVRGHRNKGWGLAG